jgi:hypothetical protein
VHALLGIGSIPALLGHPVVGGSFEGWVIEHLIEAAGAMSTHNFYRTQDGAEIDLLLEVGTRRIAIEIKRSAATRPSRGFHIACNDVQASARWLVHGGNRSFPLADGVLALTLPDALAQLGGA